MSDGSEECVSTSETECVVPGQWVRESRLVGVQVDGSHTRLVSPTGKTWDHNGISDAAISKPASKASIQAQLPGGMELSNRGQGGILALTVFLSFWEAELIWLGCKEHLTWRKIASVSH